MKIAIVDSNGIVWDEINLDGMDLTLPGDQEYVMHEIAVIVAGHENE